MSDTPALELELNSKEAISRLNDPNYVWIDVREPHEYSHGHIPNTLHLPLSELTLGHFDQFDSSKILVMVCRSGARSGMVVDTLRKMGKQNVLNLSGGLIALNSELAEKVPLIL